MRYTAGIVQGNHQSLEWAQELHCGVRKEPFHSFSFVFIICRVPTGKNTTVSLATQGQCEFEITCSTGSLFAHTSPWFMDTSYINPFLSHSSKYETTVRRTKYSSIFWTLISTVFTGTL